MGHEYRCSYSGRDILCIMTLEVLVTISVCFAIGFLVAGATRLLCFASRTATGANESYGCGGLVGDEGVCGSTLNRHSFVTISRAPRRNER